MSDKLVWSSHMTQNRLLDTPDDELRTELVDYGYDEEMLSQLDHKGLMDLVADDYNFYDLDAQEFEYNIAPEIAKQTKDGIVLLSGSVGRWDGERPGGIACQVEDLREGDICKDCDEISIHDIDGKLVWEGVHHDGRHIMELFALPEDHEGLHEFIVTCMPDDIEEVLEYHDDWSREEAVEAILEDDLDELIINDYCNFSKVPDACEPIRSILTNESCETIDEAKSKDPEALEYELAEIEADYEDFGPEGFYAVPFTSFEKQFPEFTKTCVRKFLYELEILTPEELEDTDMLNTYWKEGELIQPDDWPCLIDGANRLISTRKDKGVQWQKIWAAHSHIE